MNAQIEAMLESLIEANGLETVRRHLKVLIGEANWNDWQRLDSWISHAANRLERRAQ